MKFMPPFMPPFLALAINQRRRVAYTKRPEDTVVCFCAPGIALTRINTVSVCRRRISIVHFAGVCFQIGEDEGHLLLLRDLDLTRVADLGHAYMRHHLRRHAGPFVGTVQLGRWRSVALATVVAH